MLEQEFEIYKDSSKEQEKGVHVSATWHTKSEPTFKMYCCGSASCAWWKTYLNAFLTEKQHIMLSELLKASQNSRLYFKLDSPLDISVFELFRTWNALQNTEIKSSRFVVKINCFHVSASAWLINELKILWLSSLLKLKGVKLSIQ